MQAMPDRVRLTGQPGPVDPIVPSPPTTCSVQGCDTPAKTRGWCARHYRRVLQSGDPGPAERWPARDREPCSIPGCDRPYVARGWCHMHYLRWRGCGDPLGVKPRILPWLCQPKLAPL